MLLASNPFKPDRELEHPNRSRSRITCKEKGIRNVYDFVIYTKTPCVKWAREGLNSGIAEIRLISYYINDLLLS